MSMQPGMLESYVSQGARTGEAFFPLASFHPKQDCAQPSFLKMELWILKSR